MLGKLLKQDFRATARIMLPLYAAVPVLGLFTNLITRLCENQNGFLIRAIGALVSFVFSLTHRRRRDDGRAHDPAVLPQPDDGRGLPDVHAAGLDDGADLLEADRLDRVVSRHVRGRRARPAAVRHDRRLRGYRPVSVCLYLRRTVQHADDHAGAGRLAHRRRGRAGGFVRPCPVPDDLRRHGDRSEFQEKQRGSCPSCSSLCSGSARASYWR